MQFTDFLVGDVRKIEEIALIMPSMSSLLGDVGLSVPIAFQLVRPLIRAALQKSKYMYRGVKCSAVYCSAV